MACNYLLEELLIFSLSDYLSRKNLEQNGLGWRKGFTVGQE
jgi:hypothetical protein